MSKSKEDVRWIQRFDSYKRALNQLNSAIELLNERNLSLLEKQGLIKAFEFTHEQAWNLLKEYLEYQGYQDIKGSRDAIKMAFKIGLIKDGELWIESIKARNLTSHAYNEEVAQEIFKMIIERYFNIFNELYSTFEIIIQKEEKSFE